MQEDIVQIKDFADRWNAVQRIKPFIPRKQSGCSPAHCASSQNILAYTSIFMSNSGCQSAFQLEPSGKMASVLGGGKERQNSKKCQSRKVICENL